MWLNAYRRRGSRSFLARYSFACLVNTIVSDSFPVMCMIITQEIAIRMHIMVMGDNTIEVPGTMPMKKKSAIDLLTPEKKSATMRQQLANNVQNFLSI